MTNKELQKRLDERKWNKSKEEGRDMTGKMPYCFKCEDHTTMLTGTEICCISQEDRVAKCACAKAYRKKK